MDERLSDVFVYSIPMPIRFRGITERQGMIWKGSAGWAEWSPFLDYGPAEAATWLKAANEMAEEDYPEPIRDSIPVNATIPAVDPQLAHRLAAQSGCTTAKVKVAETGQTRADDIARVEAVRDALGPQGKVRIDANGGWGVDAAEKAIRELRRFGLEYVEQPCRRVEELADLRKRIRAMDVLIAADESIRRAEDPYIVRDMEAADIAILKVQPLGGVRACLEIAERIGMDVVVSSAVETSVGLRAGVALAAALPTLKYACGLNTLPLLGADVVTDPLTASCGQIAIHDVNVSAEAARAVAADALTTAFWFTRLEKARQSLPRSSRDVHD